MARAPLTAFPRRKPRRSERMMHPSPPRLPLGVVRGDMVSGGGTFGAAPTSYGSSGRVELSVNDGGGTFGAAPVIT